MVIKQGRRGEVCPICAVCQDPRKKALEAGAQVSLHLPDPPPNQFQKGSPSTRLHGDRARQMAALLSR